ncbi:D-sedoheptulose 7-phosphate isomerase [Psittacicella gerlachiana]|uniref:Phosphoheptose isomerase n=1 Tax=Psittacicella gerlachiana TaxID=2028574 RepID=A0A3A1Y8D4_9GAMM|nr:D-sedoheptulose 7-phosphate isomerase [Psittacicella gerlachiana]RIY33915.1 phosphoheptose isomerase [Psittacicella gerlachiana]
MSLEIIKQELSEAKNTLDKVLANEELLNRLNNAAILIARALKNGNKVISCGNGGSHCDAMHFAEELSGRYREDRPAYAAIAISDPSHLSCVGNDYGFEYVFSRFVEGLGKKDDVLFAITTSGSSENVVNACHAAKKAGMKVIALTGKDGGTLFKYANLTDIELRVPHTGYADRIQEIHIKFIHILILLIEKHLAN